MTDTAPARADQTDSPAGRSRRSRRGLAATLALMGPSFIAGAWQFGPGNLASAVQAGSAHGYALIWVIAVSTLLMIVFTDMSVRLAIVSPGSLVQTIKDRLGRPVGTAAGIGVFLISLCFSVGNAVGSGLGFSMLFGGSPTLWTIGCTVVVGAVAWAPNYYKLFERAMLGLVVLMGIGFVLGAFLSKPDWVAAADGLFPTVPSDAGLLIIALVGTNFSINAAFFTGYASRERGLKAEDYRTTTIADTIPGILAPGIMTALVIVTAAAALQNTGTGAATFPELANVLRPVAGDFGATLFGLGFSAAAFSSMVANATAGGTLLSDGLGLGNTMDKVSVKLGMFAVLAFGLTVTLVSNGSPVELIITAQALTVIVAPLLGLLLFVMTTRRDVMGRHVNRWWQNALGVVGLVAIFALCYRLLTIVL